MKKVSFAVCLAIALLSAGCATNQTRVGEGAVLGGLAGAGVGGIIGHQSGHGGQGAGIGAAVGALTGALIGSQIEKNPGQQNQAQAAPASQQQVSPNQISIQQIAQMAKDGVHEDVIIDKIRLTNSRYNLSANDLDYLRQNGVTQKVISAMQGA